MSETNGVDASGVVEEPLSLLAGVSDGQLAAICTRMDQSFAASLHHDTRAADHARHVTSAFLVLLVVWVLTVGVGLWFFAHSRDIEPYVQTVVYDKEENLLTTGIPQELLAYQPKNGEWLAMLRQWVQNYRWRTDEHERLLTQEAWQWLYGYTCGGAAEKLAANEKDEQPLIRTDIVRSVKLQPITQTPTTFVAVWEETTVDKKKGTKTSSWQVGTFTVGRTKPGTRKDADLNPTGLCVTSYHIKDGTQIH